MDETLKRLDQLSGYTFDSATADPVMSPSGQTTLHLVFTKPGVGDQVSERATVSIVGVKQGDITIG